jgi:aminopeptidase N
MAGARRPALLMHMLPLLLGLLAVRALAAEAVPQGRLPDAAKPVAYRLDLTVVPEQQRFSGHAEIDIVLKAATRSLYLHGRDLQVAAATAISGGRSTAITYTEVDPLGVARLTFAQELPAGPATLVFDYDAPFGNDAAGFYRSKVGDDWYSWTQFQSIEARAAFPCFDEPGFKTPFTVSLTTKPGQLALSNAPESGSPLPVGELLKHRFAPTLPLPTYLLAFVVGPFLTVEGVAPPNSIRNWPLPLRVVATRNHAGRLDYALRETPRIVELLETYFGQPFPFPKLDQIASPLMPGAMENAGADIYGDNILLLDEAASTRQKQVFGMTVSHELSHQWFGDLVTPAWWDDIWLNESFANWMGYRIGNEWRPELHIGIGAIDEALRAMDLDSFEAGRPVQQPIELSSEIDTAFDAITYGKGGQIVAMIASYLGDEKFRDGVRLHMRRRPYGSASSGDFFGALADAAGDARVLAALRSFVGQQGVPLVQLRPRSGAEGDAWVATQSRYQRMGGTAPSQQWAIPFCARRGEASSCTLLDGIGAVSVKGSGPLVPNAGGTGYYRYNLVPADWEALLTQAASLPAGEALTASSTLWSQFTAGELPASLLLRATRAFAANADSSAALDGGKALAGLNARGMIVGTAQADYRKFMTAVYGRRFAALGFNPAAGAHSGDAPDQQKLRQQMLDLVVDDVRDTVVRRQLAAAAKAFLGGNTTALDQAFYNSAMHVHVEEGGLAATKALYERILVTPDELFRAAALDALGTSGRKEDARWLIGQFSDQRLRSPDRLTIMQSLVETQATREQAFDWFQSHYEEFVKGTGLFAVLSTPRLPQSFCSVQKAAEIDRVLRPKVVASGRGELAIRRTIEQVRSCGLLKDAKSAELAAALKQAAAN